MRQQRIVLVLIGILALIGVLACGALDLVDAQSDDAPAETPIATAVTNDGGTEAADGGMTDGDSVTQQADASADSDTLNSGGKLSYTANDIAMLDEWQLAIHGWQTADSEEGPYLLVDATVANQAGKAREFSPFLQSHVADATGVQADPQAVIPASLHIASQPGGVFYSGERVRGTIAYKMPSKFQVGDGMALIAELNTFGSPENVTIALPDDQGVTSASVAETATPQRGTLEQPLTIRSDIDDTTDVRLTVWSGGPVQRANANRYLQPVVVDVTIENTAGEEVFFDTGVFRLRDGAGRRYSRSHTGRVALGLNNPGGSLAVGEKRRGQVLFFARPEATSFTLETRAPWIRVTLQ